MQPLTRVQAALILKAAQQDPRPFMERMLRIVDKNRLVRPFAFNAAQAQVHEKVLQLRAQRKAVRLITLKARQLGISTLTQGYLFAWLMGFPGSRAMTLAHERTQSQKLAQMSATFLREMNPSLRPIYASTANRMTLGDLGCTDGFIALNSVLNVDTATGKEVGRGDTLHFVHASEVAFWPDAGRTLTGLLNSVPYNPDTMVMLESTANGVGDEFHDRWLAAERGDSDFVPIFLPWFVTPEYQRDYPKAWEPNEDERALAREYDLTWPQLYWRATKIATDFDGDVDRFNQEFPATSSEAFIVSGQPAFKTQRLLEYRKRAMGLKFIEGMMESSDRFQEAKKGPMRVWERPKAGHEYVVAVDTALGVEGGDLCAIAVFDRTTGDHVADYLRRIDPRSLAHDAVKVALWYNTAILAIEINNTGLATQLEAVEQLRYPNPYLWRRYDDARSMWTNKIGWETNRRTRPMMIDDMGWAINAGCAGLVSVRLIDQLMGFDAGAPRPGDDDLAMAAMIAFCIHVNYPMKDGRMPRVAREAARPPEAEPTATTANGRAAYTAAKQFLQQIVREQRGVTSAMQDVSDAVGTTDGDFLDQMPDIPY